MVKRLKKRTNFIKVSQAKFFKDFDLSKDFKNQLNLNKRSV